MTGRTRYGDLVGRAAAGVAAGQALLTGGPLGDRADALRTIEAYRDLLRALSRHGRALLGGDDRIAGVRSFPHDDPRERIAAHLIDAARRAAGRAPIPDATRRGGGPVAHAWAAAAVSVRAATDLLATHRSPDGGERGPFAALLDEPTVRVAGLGGLAQLTHTAAGAADGLGLRAGQAGLSWGQVRRLVPATKHVAALSARLLRLCSPTPGGAADQLGNLGLARPAVRTDTAVHELADRLARMHRGAWELAGTRDVGVASLLDYAALGVILHGHTAAALQTHAPSRDGAGDLAARRPIAPVKQGGAVWQSTHLRLRELRTATPGSLALRADLQRVRQLLGDLAPLGPSACVTAAGAVDRGVLATLAGGLRSLGDIAGWNEHVLDGLLADSTADAIRSLDYATVPNGDDVTYPSDVAAVIGGLEILARRLRLAHTLSLVTVDRFPRLWMLSLRVASLRVEGRLGFTRVRTPLIADEDLARVVAQCAVLTKDPHDLFRPNRSADAADLVPGGER